MGIMNMPRSRMYWAKETRFPPIANMMHHKRFEDLGRFINLNDYTELIINHDD